MSNKRFFDYNPYTKTTQWFIDEEDGGFSIYYEQDVEQILEANKDKQTYGRDYYVSKDETGEYHKVASIPLNVWFQWLNEDGVDVYDPANEDYLIRKLNDHDWLYLKTADVRI